MIGDNIRNLRIEKKLTQGELGELIGVGRATISSWETNRTEPSMEMIKLLSEKLKCTKSTLIDGVSYESVVKGATQEEESLINAWRRLAPESRSRVMAFILDEIIKEK